jgi:cysteine desulfurase
MRSRVYLDHNATSPLRPEAREAMIAALDCVGNPSSIHAEGRAARRIVETARETIAAHFELKPANVYFTSGGTEAANWLLQPQAGTKCVLSAAEHPCVLFGHRFEPEHVTFVPVSADGALDLEIFDAALCDGAIAAVQAANNETGVVQPLDRASAIAKEKGAKLICDAVQAVGRLPLRNLEKADALFFSAHKFGGPKGAGAVIVRDAGLRLEPLVRGGGQERRQRSGTENVAGIAGMAAALDASVADQSAFAIRSQMLRGKLEASLRSMAPEVTIFGENAERLPNTTCFAAPAMSAATALIAFDLEGIAVSSGSACSSGKVGRSHVLDAMGAGAELGAEAIRVSTGWTTTEADIARFLAVFERIYGTGKARRAA